MSQPTPEKQERLSAISSATWAGFAALIYISDPVRWPDFAAYARFWLPGSEWDETDRSQMMKDAQTLKSLAEFTDRQLPPNDFPSTPSETGLRPL